eukprot:107865-Pelagomonas_calceolata.AAC.1
MVRNRNHKWPEWFNDACAARKKAFLMALKTGQARQACEQLHREYRAEAQRAKQRYTRTRAVDSCASCSKKIRLYTIF